MNTIRLLPIIAMCAVTSPSYAVTALADAENKIENKPRAAGATTLTLKAYSESGGKKNEDTSDSTKPRIMKPNPAPPPDTIEVDAPADELPNDSIVVGPADNRRTYGPPVVGFKDKTPKPPLATVESITGPARGRAELTGPSSGPNPNPPPAMLEHPGSVRAEGRLKEGETGRAAGEAIDPYLVLPDLYSYSFFINDVFLQTEDERDYAGVTFFATDSRYDDGLWSLGIAVEGLLQGIADIDIQFQSQSVLLNLDAATIESLVRNSFVIVGNTAQLSSLELFDTSYDVDQTILFGEGTNAGVEAVPEPYTWLLIGYGLAGLAAWRMRCTPHTS